MKQKVTITCYETKTKTSYVREDYYHHVTDLLTGLDTANGVAIPIDFMRCCIVGVADVDDKFAPMRGTFDCCTCCTVIGWSGESASGVYALDGSMPLLLVKKNS